MFRHRSPDCILSALCRRGLAGTPSAGPPAEGSLTGYWKLDRDRSDDPDEKAREAMEGFRTGDHGPGSAGPWDPRTRNPTGGGSGYPQDQGRSRQGGGDPLRAVLSAIDRPGELLIAQRTTLVLIQDGDDEGSVRGVHTSGQRRALPADRGEFRGQWVDGRLVVETWGRDGLRTKETFALSSDPRELTVTVTVTAPGLAPLTVTSLYVPDGAKNR